jgi:hypothetical protein
VVYGKYNERATKREANYGKQAMGISTEDERDGRLELLSATRGLAGGRAIQDITGKIYSPRFLAKVFKGVFVSQRTNNQ